MFLAAVSAPFSKSREHGHNRLHGVVQYGHTTITERQTQRKIGQVRDTQKRMVMEQGAGRLVGYGRSGQGRVA